MPRIEGRERNKSREKERGREKRGPFYCIVFRSLMEGLANETNDSDCDSNCLVIKSYPQKSTWHEQNIRTQIRTHKTCHIFLWSPLPLTNPCVLLCCKKPIRCPQSFSHTTQSPTATLQRFTASQLSCSHFRYPIATSVLLAWRASPCYRFVQLVL